MKTKVSRLCGCGRHCQLRVQHMLVWYLNISLCSSGHNDMWTDVELKTFIEFPWFRLLFFYPSAKTNVLIEYWCQTVLRSNSHQDSQQGLKYTREIYPAVRLKIPLPQWPIGTKGKLFLLDFQPLLQCTFIGGLFVDSTRAVWDITHVYHVSELRVMTLITYWCWMFICSCLIAFAASRMYVVLQII